jgi:aconitate hydratase
MLAIGAGGLDVAIAMGGGSYYLIMPELFNIILKGRLRPAVSAKDVILNLLKMMTVSGGVGKILEYTGEGITTLSVPERATIANMGAELGATASIFPSDHVTRRFLAMQGRENAWTELLPEKGSAYQGAMELDLDEIEPMAALPHSPDNVEKVRELEGLKIHQVAIGSCTNSSYLDLMRVARIMKGRTVHPGVSLVISPGSRQVLTMLASNGALADLLDAGARILETACGPCIGMGQVPETDAVTLRTFNRNFRGRCGSDTAMVYLVSPETAAVSSIAGELHDPRRCDVDLAVELPGFFHIRDNLIIEPSSEPSRVEILRGPNIKPFPVNALLPHSIEGNVLLKMGDNITTDCIVPSNASLLPYRSNIPYLAGYCFASIDSGFTARALKYGGGFLVGGENYGQGSSREHAALVPLFLGVKGVLAKSFARIHRANLVNSGILPLRFKNPEAYDSIEELDILVMDAIECQLSQGGFITVVNLHKNCTFEVEFAGSERDRETVMAGGKINWMKARMKSGAFELDQV